MSTHPTESQWGPPAELLSCRASGASRSRGRWRLGPLLALLRLSLARQPVSHPLSATSLRAGPCSGAGNSGLHSCPMVRRVDFISGTPALHWKLKGRSADL